MKDARFCNFSAKYQEISGILQLILLQENLTTELLQSMPETTATSQLTKQNPDMMKSLEQLKQKQQSILLVIISTFTKGDDFPSECARSMDPQGKHHSSISQSRRNSLRTVPFVTLLVEPLISSSSSFLKIINDINSFISKCPARYLQYIYSFLSIVESLLPTDYSTSFAIEQKTIFLEAVSSQSPPLLQPTLFLLYINDILTLKL